MYYMYIRKKYKKLIISKISKNKIISLNNLKKLKSLKKKTYKTLNHPMDPLINSLKSCGHEHVPFYPSLFKIFFIKIYIFNYIYIYFDIIYAFQNLN